MTWLTPLQPERLLNQPALGTKGLGENPLEKITFAMVDDFTPPNEAKAVFQYHKYDTWRTKTYLSHGEMVELACKDACHQYFGDAFSTVVSFSPFNVSHRNGRLDEAKLEGVINAVSQPGFGVDYVNTSFSEKSKKAMNQYDLPDTLIDNSRANIKRKRPYFVTLLNRFEDRWYTAAPNRDDRFSDYCALKGNTCVGADRDGSDGKPYSESELVDETNDPRLHLIVYDKEGDGNSQLFWGVDRNCDGFLQADEYHSDKPVDSRATLNSQPLSIGDVVTGEDKTIFEGNSFATPRAMVKRAYQDNIQGRAQHTKE